MRTTNYIIGVFVILIAIIICFAIPEMPLAIFTAIFLLVFGLVCLPPIRDRVAFLRSRLVTAAILAGSMIGAIASLVIATPHQSYTLAADTKIAAKECYLATIKKNHEGDKLPLDSLIEATQYGFASLSMTRSTSDPYDKIQEALYPVGMDVNAIADRADAIVEQCHVRFPGTAVKRVIFPESNFSTMLLCHDLTQFIAAEASEVGVTLEDKGRLAKLTALADKIQPMMRADMLLDGKGEKILVDGGKTRIDPVTLKTTVVLNASENSNFVALVNACVDKFSS